MLLVPAGLEKPGHTFEARAKDVKGHGETPGRRVQSTEEPSFDTWIRLCRSDQDAPSVSESCYERGAHICLAPDLTIRGATGEGGRSASSSRVSGGAG